MEVPREVRLAPVDPMASPAGRLMSASERRADGKIAGELEIAVFGAAIVIDREGILEETVTAAAEQATASPAEGRIVEIAHVTNAQGLDGYRADVVLTRDANGPAELPFVSFLALARDDAAAAAGALFIRVACASTPWPACAAMIESIAILL
jgi:hypothetical protein